MHSQGGSLLSKCLLIKVMVHPRIMYKYKCYIRWYINSHFETLKQEEYRRGVSEWNFDIADLKAQAALVRA